jgi:hypothetical protein
MMRILLWVGLAIGVVLGETSTGDKLPGERQPVLVELLLRKVAPVARLPTPCLNGWTVLSR